MTTHRRSLIVAALLALLFLVQSAGAPHLLARGSQLPASPADELRAAWERARAAGSYRFAARAEQTYIPRPIPAMIGQSDFRLDLDWAGALQLPDRAYIELRAQNARAAMPPAVLLRDKGQAFLEQSGRLEPIEDPLGIAAPAADILGYLAAADQVTRLAPRTEDGQALSGYSFVLSGPRFAAYISEQQTGLLRAQPGAPQGLTAAPSPALSQISGQGELWVDGAGLPVRQTLDVTLPEVSDSYGVFLHMVVELGDYGRVQSLPVPVQGGDGTWRMEGQIVNGLRERITRITPAQATTIRSIRSRNPLTALLSDYSTGVLVAIPLLLLAVVVVRCYRRYRRMARLVIVCALVIVMVFTPLLQAGQWLRFGEQQVRAAEARAAAAPRLLEALGLAAPTGAALATATPTASAFPTQTATAMPTATVAQPDRLPRAAQAIQILAANQASALRRCGEGAPGVDTDNDGLSDATENCLGSDPANPDSDGDGIPDGVEVAGFDLGGHHWTSNPLDVDSNHDGISDYQAWAAPIGLAANQDLDGDGIPNIWDDDMDGDGVPNWLDLSPMAVVADSYATTLSLSTQGLVDGYEYIELQVQPQNRDHLRYFMKTLDWPADDKGNIQDLDGSSDDLRLIPFLFIDTNVAPTEALAERYGFRAWPSGSGYALLVPLLPVDEGGAVYAYSAKVAYGPGPLADVQWQAKMVWMVQAQIDSTYQHLVLGADGRIVTQTDIQTESSIVKQYEDSFRVTGLNITHSRGYEALAFGTPTSAGEDRALFQVLFGLNATFLEYEKLADQAAGETMLATLARRFIQTGASPYTPTFGVAPNLVAMSDRAVYGHHDEGLGRFGAEQTPAFLGRYYRGTPCRDAGGNAIPCASVVIAFEESLAVVDQKDLPAGSLHANLASAPLTTVRGARLVVYEQGVAGWQQVEPARALEFVEARYSSQYGTALRTAYPRLETVDLRFMAYMGYLWALAGRTSVLSVGGVSLMSGSPDDEAIARSLQVPADLATQANTALAYTAIQSGFGKYISDFRLLILPNMLSGTRSVKAMWTGYQALTKPGAAPTAACRWAAGASLGLGIAAGAASLVMMGIGIACTVDDSQPICRNKDALKAANLGVNIASATAQAVRAATMGSQWLNGTLAPMSKAGWGMAAAGMVIGVAASWVQFGLGAAKSDNPVIFNVGLGLAIVSTIWYIFLFAINFVPIVGQLISAILALIDTLISVFTGGEWSMARVILNFFYDAAALTKVGTATFGDFAASFSDANKGLVAGNVLQIKGPFTGTMVEDDSDCDNDDLRASWIQGVMAAQGSGSFASQDKNTTRNCNLVNGELKCSNTAGVGWVLASAINGRAAFQTYVRYNYRWAEYGLFGAFRWKTHSESKEMPESGKRETTTLYFDVLPDTLDGLWNWSALTNPDHDGDGLPDALERILGTDPYNWDSDGDGLSDKFEVDNRARLGCDPLKYDTDGDGLSDRQELRLGTKIADADSDKDDLCDGDETFHRRADGTWNWEVGWQMRVPGGQTFRVISDPLQSDADGDGLNDGDERRNGFGPYGINDPVPTLLVEALPLSGLPGGAAGMYLTPGQTVTLAVQLYNWAPLAVTGTLSIGLPDFLTDINWGSLRGDRNPPHQVLGNAFTSGYTFGGAYTLQTYEAISTTVTARVGSAGASAGSLTVGLPYRGQTISRSISAVRDGDDPTVAILAPADGAALRGTSHVLGAAAADATTWVSGGELSIAPAGSQPSFQALAGAAPWAYTWALPGDGTYVVQARAHDAVGHSGLSAPVTVRVDNTAPSATLNATGFLSGGATTVRLTGSASDNLSGVSGVQVSVNGQPWRLVTLAAPNSTSTTWLFDWEAGADAQGTHQVAVRAWDRAGNAGATVSGSIVVDRVPPASRLIGGANSAHVPSVAVGQPLTLTGLADEGGYLPAPAVPKELKTGLGVLGDATIWLGLSSVHDNDQGVSAAWLGDVNSDRLADLAVALPAAADGRGCVAILYGRAGGWATPPDLEMLGESPTRFTGAAGAGLGKLLAAAGDANGDGYADLLVGEASSARAFLVFGKPGPLGEVSLDGPQPAYRTVLRAPATITCLAAAGDVNGDGIADLLVVAGGTAYLIAGASGTWPETIDISAQAAAVIPGVQSAQGVGYLNDDALADFAVTSTGSMALFLGAGNLTAGARQALSLAGARATFAASATPMVVALGDVNGDGRADFAYSGAGAPQLVFGNAAASSWTTQAFPGHDRILAAPGDVNGDGYADLLLGNAAQEAALIVGRAGTSLSVTPLATISGVAAAASTLYAAGADANSDGSADLLLIPSAGAAAAEGYDGPSFRPGGLVRPELLPRAAAQGAPGPTAQGEAGTAASIVHTFYVDNNPGGCGGNTPCYQTIQAAIDAADDAGDTIIVYPGAYAAFQVSGHGKDNLTIRGLDPDAVFVDGAGAAYAVRIQGADALTLANLTLRNATRGLALDHAGRPDVGGGRETRLDHLLVHGCQSAIYMDRYSAASVTGCTLVGDGATAHPILEVDAAGNGTYTWTGLAAVPAAMSADGAILNANGQLLAVPMGASRAVHAYNAGTNSWSQLTSLPHEPYSDEYVGHSAVAASGDALHVFVQRAVHNRFATANGFIWAVARHPTTGDIYVTGDFSSVGGITANGVARWDGSAWHSLGENLDNGIFCESGGSLYPGGGRALAFDATGNLYVGGLVAYGGRVASRGIVRWDGAQWRAVGVPGGPGGVYALATHGNDVYAGGVLDSAWGNVARWDGSAWQQLGTGVWGNVNNGSVCALAVDASGNVYAGGRFTQAGGQPANHIAKWDGSAWSALGGGVGCIPAAIAVDGSGAPFVSGGSYENYDGTVLRWNGASWVDTGTRARALVSDACGHVYAGGDYTFGVGVSVWEGSGWRQLGQPWDDIYGLVASQHNGVYVVGKEWLGDSHLSYVQGAGHDRYDLSTGTWQLTRSLAPGYYGLTGLAGDGAGGLYGFSYSGTFYHYDDATDAWQTLPFLPSASVYCGGQTYAGGRLYALRLYCSSACTSYLYTYDPTAGTWDSRPLPPAVSDRLGSDPAVWPWSSEGASLVWDGGDYLYLLVGGGTKRFYRYLLSEQAWEGPFESDLAFTVSAGAALTRLGDQFYVYGADAGAGSNTFRFGAVGVPDRRLSVAGTAFVAPPGSTAPRWTSLSSAEGALGFRADVAADNAWVAPAGADWGASLPSGARVLASAQAAFLDSAHGVYRLGAASTLAAGYHRYRAEAHVYPTQAACDRCGTGGDLAWGETAFDSIRSAVESGAARVLVHPGRYPQPFYLVSGVQVIGSGAETTIVEPPAGGTGILVMAEGIAGATLARLTLAGAPGWDGLLVEGGARSVKVSRNILRDLGTALRIRGDSQVEVVNNTIVRNTNGMAVEGTTPVNVRNTLLAYHSGTALSYGTPSSLANGYNGFWANGTHMSPADPGGGKVYLDPLLADLAANDLRLGKGSPLIDAGAPGDPAPPATGGRVDIGYREYGGAAFYAGKSYGPTALNDGLTWGVDAFASIGEALEAARSALAGLQGALPEGGYTVGVGDGTWNERVSVPSHVHLAGTGADRAAIAAGGVGSPVSFDGVVQAGVSGLRLSGAADAGVAVNNTSNAIEITRNLIVGNPVGVRFAGRSSGSVTFNTIVGDAGSLGVLATGEHTWLDARNNIISGHGTGLRSSAGGLIRQGYNLLDNTQNLDGPAPSANTQTGSPAFAAGAGYYLTAASPAVDAAEPLAPVPAGGGLRADLGYRELLASPLSLFLGPQIAATATASSGVARVEVGWQLVSDPSRPVTATLPTSWTSIAGNGSPLCAWSSTVTPASAGLYRVYSRAHDAAGNVEGDAAALYSGAFYADSTAPVLSWVTPPPGTTTAAAVEVLAQAQDYIDTGSGPRLDVREVYFQVSGAGRTVNYPAAWVDPIWEASGPRPFHAWLPLEAGSMYRVVAVAVDEAGHQTQSEARYVSSSAGQAATITSQATGDAVRATRLTLRGYARFTAAGAGQVRMEVDGSPAGYATLADPNATLSAWTATVALPAADGPHNVSATPMRGGTSGTVHNITLTLDRVAPPTLVVTTPASGDWVTQTALFQGTASDDRSGLAAVEVSVDGGYTWRRAQLSAGIWSLSWDLPGRQDFVSYPVRIRALDRAGNATVVERTITVDSLPPSDLRPVTPSLPEGQHVEIGSRLDLQWNEPFDASGTAQVRLTFDKNAGDEPSQVVSGQSAGTALSSTGDWYAHLEVRDAAGNGALYHYGPWHVRDMYNSTFSARRQSIVVDGLIDLAHDEWRESDLLGTDARPDTPQRLYTTWDGQALYLGWSGAWWTLDGSLWAFLDVAPGGTHTRPASSRTVPILADLAVEVRSPSLGALWRWNGSSWVADSLQFAHGPTGDTEARIPWNVSASQQVQLVALALPRSGGAQAAAAAAGDGDPWAAFPPSNSLDDLDDNYSWSEAGAPPGANDEQPQVWTVNMAVSSPQAQAAAWCPGSDIQYRIVLENRELSEVTGLTLAVAGSAGLTYPGHSGPGWSLNVPTIPAQGSQTLTVDARLAGDLSGVSTVTTLFTLSAGSVHLAGEPVVGNVAHRVDGQAPTVAIDALPGLAIAAGRRTFTGTASDGGGSGVARVEVRVTGGAWQAATGGEAWRADLDVPAGSQFTLEARAVDGCGRTSEAMSRTFNVDSTAPQITFPLPPVLNLAQPVLAGTTVDPQPAGALVSRVEVQIDREDAPWLPASGPFAPAGGLQNWVLAWNVAEDGLGHQLRARATDSAGNSSTTAWSGTRVDNIAPTITVTLHSGSVTITDYLAMGGARPDDRLSQRTDAAPAAFYLAERLGLPALSQAMAGPPVLEGTVSDGSGLSQVRVLMYSPLSQVYSTTLALTAGQWEYTPRLSGLLVGLYALYVEATDAYGNTRVSGPYDLNVRDQAVAGLQAASDGPTAQYDPTTLIATTTAGSNTVYEWDLGDGTTASGRVVTHTYASMGRYTATVTARNGVGVWQASCEVVISRPTGSLNVTPLWPSICAGWDVTLDISYRNNLPIPLTGVRLAFAAPERTMVVPAGCTPGLANGPALGQMMWEVGNVGVGQTVTRRLVLHIFSSIPQGTLLAVPVTAYAAESDPIAHSAIVEVRTDDICRNTPTPAVSPTPTATATPEGTSTATPTASTTPDGTLTPTPTATATPVGTPTPTPTSGLGDLALSGVIYGERAGAADQASAQRDRLPLAGARVVASLSGGETFAATTDAAGWYEVVIPAASLEGCDELTLEVSARGYGTLRQRFPLAELRADPRQDLTLVARWDVWLPAVRK